MEEDQTTASAGQDDWATGFSTTGKKNKKSAKKNAFDDPSEANDAPAIGTAVTEPTAAESSWGAWGASGLKKDKSKKKKGETEEIPPMPPPPPPAPVEPPADDAWSAFGTKGKKKNKKGTAEEPVVAVPEVEPTGDSEWASFGGKKDKKKGKKDAFEFEDTKFEDNPIVSIAETRPEPEPEPEPDVGWGFSSKKSKKKVTKGTEADKEPETSSAVVPEPEVDAGMGWGDFGTNKKDKKKGKRDTADQEKSKDAPITVVPDPEPEADLGWGSFGAKDKKKKGRKAIEEVEQKDDDIVAIVTEPEPIADGGWGNFGSKKNVKKGKGGSTAEVVEDKHVTQTLDLDPIPEDTFDAGWGATTKKGKKDKKGGIASVKEDTITVLDSAATAEAAKGADDDWMNWGSTDKKKDKKGKKGTVDEGLPPPPQHPLPAVSDFLDTSSVDPWATSTTSKKDKKGKKGKAVEPEPAIFEEPDPPADREAEAEKDEWAGLTASEKKKKEKAKAKEREKEEKEKKETDELEKKEREELEKKEKEEREKEKAKAGKKGKASTASATSKTKDLMADSIPDTLPAVEEDTWGSSMWGPAKKDGKKKGAKKDSPFEIPPPVPTPPAQGLTPPPEATLDDLMEDDWGTFAPAKDKDKGKKDSKKLPKAEESKASKNASKDKTEEEWKKPAEESAAKAARSFWGGMTTTTTSKSKTTKEKEAEQAKQEHELDLDLDSDLDLDEIVDIIDEDPPPKKGSKSKVSDSRVAKNTTSKDEKASKNSASDKKAKGGSSELDALIDFDELEPKGSKSKSADKDKSQGEEQKTPDAFSFWGSSKKTSGKNGDEPKKEINKPKAANQSDPLAFLSNEPEPTTPFADEPAPSQSSKPSKSAMSTSKTSGKSSVAQKVKALEEERKQALEPAAPPPPDPVDPEPSAKKTTPVSSKSKAKSPFAKKREPSPPPEDTKKSSKDSVPGSFPAEGFEEENLIDMLASSPVEKKSAKKASAKTAKAPKKEIDRDVMDVDMMMPAVPAVPAAPPTPPAEPVAVRPVKKERARVVRDEGASSWGFWAAAPKKDAKKTTKTKDDADVPSAKKAVTPVLVRSKSTKAPKEKEKDTEKSSGSDGKDKKAESRPSKSRGSSFGAFFGGPPPVRAKPVRRTSTSAASKTTSRRPSMDVDAFGLPSPPLEDAPAMTGKAAKVMGATPGKLNRNASTKGKQKASPVPDPYPIDDDDMVMVNGIDDPIINAPVPESSRKPTKHKASRSTPKRESRPVFDAADDVVMIDGPSPDEPEILAFDEKPRAPAPLQRSMTSSKKPANGKLMGLFGGFGKNRRNSETLERPKGRTIITDDEAVSPRKRTVNSREDSSKRIRRDDRKVRRSEKQDTDGFITDALNDRGPVTESEEADIRRQERRAAKREVREVEPRRDGPENEADGARQAKTTERRNKRVEDEGSQRQGEKHTRRSGKDERPAKNPAERSKHSSSRPHKSDRRRSYMDPPANDRPKAHRSRTEQSSSKRRSVAVDDYFDPRNAVPEEGKNEPYMHGANDHTSSWVKSQLSDPADPPPVEGTVIEPTPRLGGKGGYDDDEARKAARKARRQSRYGPEDEAGEGDRERRRQRKKEKESEGSVEWGGGKEREKLSRRYTDLGGVRGAVDGRPSLGAAGKRSSWLKKVTGMGP